MVSMASNSLTQMREQLDAARARLRRATSEADEAVETGVSIGAAAAAAYGLGYAEGREWTVNVLGFGLDTIGGVALLGGGLVAGSGIAARTMQAAGSNLLGIALYKKGKAAGEAAADEAD